MKTKIYTLLFMLLVSTLAYAQKEKNFKSKIIFNEIVDDNQDYKLYIVNAVSTPDYTKFKLRIQNLTNDFLVYDPSKSYFIINGEKVATSEKRLVDVQPYNFGTMVLDVKNLAGIAKSLAIHIEGISKVSNQGYVLEAPAFEIPASINEIKVGGFDVLYVPSASKVENEFTELRFKFTYNGNYVGVLQGNKVALNVNGRDYAILNSGIKTQILFPGESKTIPFKWSFGKGSLDVVNAKLAVVWNKAFMEDKPKAFAAKTFDLSINPDRSK